MGVEPALPVRRHAQCGIGTLSEQALFSYRTGMFTAGPLIQAALT